MQSFDYAPDPRIVQGSIVCVYTHTCKHIHTSIYIYIQTVLSEVNIRGCF